MGSAPTYKKCGILENSFFILWVTNRPTIPQVDSEYEKVENVCLKLFSLLLLVCIIFQGWGVGWGVRNMSKAYC